MVYKTEVVCTVKCERCLHNCTRQLNGMGYPQTPIKVLGQAPLSYLFWPLTVPGPFAYGPTWHAVHLFLGICESLDDNHFHVCCLTTPD